LPNINKGNNKTKIRALNGSDKLVKYDHLTMIKVLTLEEGFVEKA